MRLLQDPASGPAAADTSDPVLRMKVTSPVLPRWSVSRPRINDLIAAGVRGRLTTVTGPPGAGKTMAVALWAAASTYPCRLAWLTLDRYDNQPRTFWSYVMVALGEAGVRLPRDLRPPPDGPDADHDFLLRLSSALSGQEPPVVLVLDDAHLVADPAVVAGLAYVLANGTPGFRLVAASRMELPLPLHRYRLTGELTEVRAADLAFSPAETATLLGHHGLEPTMALAERLTEATEGWVAGIRLAALAMEGHRDPEQFIKELDAEDSAIAGYLVDEVLDAQPPSVRNLLLRTSIVRCVNAELARELTGNDQVATMLPALARANAFVVPLGHGWYRYHAVLASVLRLKLRSESNGQVYDLRRRAARWYQRSGRFAEAVRYAADAGDWVLTSQIVVDEMAIPQLLGPHPNHTLADAFRRMPRQRGWTQPQPLLLAAAADLSADSSGEVGSSLAAADASLAAAEEMLDHPSEEDETPTRLAAALVRLADARRTGDAAAATTAVAQAEALISRLTEAARARHPEVAVDVLWARGSVELWEGRFDSAAATFTDGARAAARAGTARQRADCLAYLALVEALRERLSLAVEIAGKAGLALQAADEGTFGPLCPAATVALAAVHVERNESQPARAQLKASETALRESPDRLLDAVASLVAAQRALADGRPSAALELIGAARAGWSAPTWLQLRLTLLEARVRPASGEGRAAVAAAEVALAENPGAAAVALTYAWLAAGNLDAARRALDTAVTEAGALSPRVAVDAWLVDARIHYEFGDPVRGRRSLERAMRGAEPERLRLPFVLEQGWLRPVLRHDPGLAGSYRQLLAPRSDGTPAVPHPRAPEQPAAPLIVEELSEREREVLRYLSQMLSTVEIADELYISVNTVKTHLRSIYRKLSVSRRAEAVRRARKLSLV